MIPDFTMIIDAYIRMNDTMLANLYVITNKDSGLNDSAFSDHS